MAFKPVNPQDVDGKIKSLPMAASTTVAKYDALVFSSGYLTRADNSATEVRYVAMQGNTTGSGENDEILVLPTEGVRFEADTNAAPVQATDVGVKADLTDHDTLNESASSNDVFLIDKIIGATSDKKVQGYFVMKTS